MATYGIQYFMGIPLGYQEGATPSIRFPATIDYAAVTASQIKAYTVNGGTLFLAPFASDTTKSALITISLANALGRQWRLLPFGSGYVTQARMDDGKSWALVVVAVADASAANFRTIQADSPITVVETGVAGYRALLTTDFANLSGTPKVVNFFGGQVAFNAVEGSNAFALLAAGGVSAPANTVAPAITGTAEVGQTLTASTGTWTGTPTSYSYNWKRNGVSIGASDQNTYVLVIADFNATITVTVTATNAGGSTAATSAATTAVTFVDNFTRANGAIGSPWTGATWTIASNLALNTPVPGADIIVNGNFETWTNPTNAGTWSEFPAGTTTFNQEATDPHGGTYCGRIDVDASSSIIAVAQAPTRVVGKWYLWKCWLKGDTTTPRTSVSDQLPTSTTFTLTNAVWNEARGGCLQRTNGDFVGIRTGSGMASKSVTVDDLSYQPIDADDVMATVNSGVADVIIKADWTYGTLNQTPAGVILNLDNAANPQNYVACFLTGANNAIWLVKVVGGVPQVFLAAISTTYVASGTLEVRKSGTNYKVFYGGAQIGAGAGYTISDAGIVNNTIHGLVAIDPGATCDFFSLAAA